MGLSVRFNRPAQANRGPMHEFHRLNYHHSISGVGFYAAAEVNSVPGGFPQEPRQPETWQIGFIQNVLNIRIIARYEGGRVESFDLSQRDSPKLDALPHPNLITPRDWQLPWIYHSESMRDGDGIEVNGFANFRYGGGQGPRALRISMVDYPRTSFYNVFGGGNTGEQLRSAEEHIQFGLWVAAKKDSDPPQQRNSYKCIASTQFTFISNIEITGHNPYWAPGNSGSFSNRQTVQSSSYNFSYDQVLRPTTINLRPDRSLPRTISPPFANEVLPRIIGQTGIAPRHRFR